VGLLEDLSKITTKKGVFFLTNGEKVEGSITNIGQIAAFGDSNNQSGALIPAGEGYYKLWNNEQQEIEILHPKLQGSSALKLYILSSNKNAISERKPKNLSDTLIAGGTIGWVILALGIAAMVAILLRFFHMRKTQSQHRSLETEIAPLLEQSDKKAIEIVSGKRTGASAHLLKIVLQYVDCDKDQFEKAVTQGFIEESQKLEKLSTFITVVAAVAPLLGLLGTVTGMIATFDIITEVGAGDPKMLSGGISEALVTTMFGLIVAIPALLMGNMLSSWAENLKADMEKMVLKVSNKFARI
jgi:biopolymer transport protein ExbB